jgi:flavin reductase (DIM6/NTAB) family NADH-FMN oxidoreductase RutF
MNKISQQDLLSYEKKYRAQLINTLVGPRSAVLVGTINHQKQTNLAIFNSLTHLGADPALVGLIFRPNSVARHTLENILATQFYTVNFVEKTFYRQAHQTSARYPLEQSEFSATGLNEEYRESFVAPFVEQAKIKLGVKFGETLRIERNQTQLLVGEIQLIYLPENCLHKDGSVDHAMAQTIAVVGLDSYHSITSLGQLPYAKV